MLRRYQSFPPILGVLSYCIAGHASDDESLSRRPLPSDCPIQWLVEYVRSGRPRRIRVEFASTSAAPLAATTRAASLPRALDRIDPSSISARFLSMRMET